MISIIYSIAAFSVVFLIVALAHELGHFYFAKKNGIKVLEFGIGFGPNIFKKEYDGTIYSINLIPVLAYVRLAGIDDENEESKNLPKDLLYTSKSPSQKFLSIFAGPFMNLILGFAVYSILAMTFGLPYTSNIINRVEKNSPAEKAGLMPNDKIVKINGEKIIKTELAIEKIHKSPNKEITLTINRNGQEMEIKAVPKLNKKLNVALLGFSVKTEIKKYGFVDGIIAGAKETISISILIIGTLYNLFTGEISLSQIAGPIGIAKISGQAASQGLASFMNLIALISVNLAIFNLLPIPALDGGRLVFVLSEWIFKKPIEIELENKIHQWGLVILLVFIGIVSINDIMRSIPQKIIR